MTREKLLANGFLTFNLKDFNQSLYNKLRESIPSNMQNKLLQPLLSNYYLCTDLDILTSDFIEQFQTNYPNYSNKILPDSNIEHALNLASQPIGSRRFLEANFFSDTYKSLLDIKSFIHSNFTGVKSQSWFQGQINSNSEMFEPIYDIYENVIKTFYNIPNEYFLNLKKNGVGLTCFEEDDFIIQHQDGQNDGRYAAMLIYLNDDWKPNYGGQIILNNNVTVEPEFGKVVLFDFTKNNIIHEVIEPTSNVSRFATLTFIEI